ncbi:MAG: SCO family protein [Flavobacteriales bacterium]|nr:SCO family protein [Flavobacteriales bacterium]
MDHRFGSLPYFSAEHPTGSEMPIDYIIPPFEFQNQEGVVFTSDSLKGKIWIAACFSLEDSYLLEITAQLKSVGWKYRDEPDIAVVCFSTNPAVDTTLGLKRYVDEKTMYHRYPGKWQFLVGEKDSIDDYLHRAFLIREIEDNADLFLVDKEGHIRGKYSARSEMNVKDAMEDIALLKKQEKIKKHEDEKQGK